MEEWWGAMSQLEHVYWISALVSSILFLVVLVGTIVGGVDADMDAVDADIEADTGIGFQFLTFKNLVGFFTVFSWAGIACINAGYSNTITIIVSLVCGLAMMFLMAWAFLFMAKQAESGTLQVNNAIGKIGEVYMTVEKNRGAYGKVHIKVQGSLRELDAITDEEEDLTQGNVVKVLEVVSGELLLVEKLKK
jgi:membrane protein implicated in regulation of membrane protease activity